jgi:hypothetical protein
VPAARGLVDWLRSRSDDDLARLLSHRPEAALPSPPDLATLANRLAVRTSLARAIDALDAFALRVLEAVAVGPPLVPAEVVVDLTGAADDDVRSALLRLTERGLTWPDEAGYRLVGAVAEVLGPYPAGLGQPAAQLWTTVPFSAVRPTLTTLGLAETRQPEAGAQVAALLAEPGRLAELIGTRGGDERDLLSTIAHAGPVVALDAGERVTDAGSAAAGLARVGLIVPVDPTSVEVPREVGLTLRGPHPLAGVPARPPQIPVGTPVPLTVDGTGTTQVLEVTRQVAAVLRDWSADPPAVLRAGGLGVRELRRTARLLDLSEAATVVVVEVAAAAGLIAPASPAQPHWLPTTDADPWLTQRPDQQWRRLAEAWRDMRRQPHQAGGRDDRGRLIAPLSLEVERAHAVTTRRTLLDVLAELPAGAQPRDPAAVLDRLAWLTPRRAAALRPAAAAALAEAEQLGLTGGHALTGYGRALARGDGGRAETLLRDALPEPVGEFMLQPDLTAIVPGPPEPALAGELAATAVLESSGGAQVWRFTAATIRSAFDSGWTAERLHALLAHRSRTPVPQALSYLVDDAARSHGRLRAGAVACYVRGVDAALIDDVDAAPGLAGLALHRLAPTVMVSPRPLDEVLAGLRAAGFSPAAESADGLALAAAPDADRSRAPRRAERSPAAGLSAEVLAETVRRMRRGDELARTAQPVTVSTDVPGVTSARTLGLLRDAIRADNRVWVAYVDAVGTPATRIIEPLSLGGGFLRGHDAETKEFRSIPLHRLTSVNVLTDDADPQAAPDPMSQRTSL